jgi:hypothetical protein
MSWQADCPWITCSVAASLVSACSQGIGHAGPQMVLVASRGLSVYCLHGFAHAIFSVASFITLVSCPRAPGMGLGAA